MGGFGQARTQLGPPSRPEHMSHLIASLGDSVVSDFAAFLRHSYEGWPGPGPLPNSIHSQRAGFFGGGFGSVRGFRDNSMGPRSGIVGSPLSDPEPIGGNVQVEAGAELIFPTPFIEDNNKVRTLAFFDAGNIFDTRIKGPNGESFSPDAGQLRYSVGLGLSWITPIGPLTFAVAQPLNDTEDDDTQVFQFSLGQGF